MTRPLRLATRRSQLALTQARGVGAMLQELHPGLTIEELQVVTTGDRFRDRPLQDIGGKGLFLKEIEQALVDGKADIAVHSMKDVPAELAPGLTMAAIPAREDPRDALFSRTGQRLDELPAGARVGTSSLRRRTLVLEGRPDLEVLPLRGNVDTRLRKATDGEVDAVILALAGLRRLGLTDRATEIFDPGRFLPAVGQGALGIECRHDDEEVLALLAAADHPETRICVSAERAFMAAVEGSCRMPVAAHAVRAGDELHMSCLLADDDGSRARRAEEQIPWPDDLEAAAALGQRLGSELRAR